MRGLVLLGDLLVWGGLASDSGLPVALAVAVGVVAGLVALRGLLLGVVVRPDAVVVRNVLRTYRLRAADVAAADDGAAVVVAGTRGVAAPRRVARALRVTTRDGRTVVASGVAGRSAARALAAVHAAMPWTAPTGPDAAAPE
jgi:hypothetical protein